MKIQRVIVEHPKTVIFLCLIPVLVAVLFLPRLVVDVRSDAFLAEDNPALVYKRQVKEQFGLSDPIVVAVQDKSAAGVFNATTLELLRSLTEQLSDLPNVDSSGVVSLASEKNIAATDDGMTIAPFYEEVPSSVQELEALRSSVFDFPLYRDNLVSTDAKVTLVILEMLDERKAGQTYRNVVDIVESLQTPAEVELYVAGEGAIIGYLGGYVDADARRLVPFCGVVITLVLVLAYRGLVAALLTNAVVVATLVITMGIMAFAGVPFFVITNALPVILIGISVADAIHVYLHFFDLQRRSPGVDGKSLVIATMTTMWRPLTLTSLTTIAGFLGLYFSGYMPPFVYFGLFAAVGVAVAWCYTLTFLPAVMVLTSARPGRQQPASGSLDSPGFWNRVLVRVGDITFNRAPVIVCIYGALALGGLLATSYLVVDENPIRVFNPKERIVLANDLINRKLSGSNTLDIVVDTPAAEDLFLPENLRKIEALQEFVATLPEVGGSVSIVDYLKQMNRSLNDGAAREYRLPRDKETVAQYFLLYSATSDPTDFEEEVDYEYKTANIRVYVKSGDYQDVKIIVEALHEYLEESFNDGQITATLSGRVNVHYRWIRELARSHFIGLGVAISLVLLVSSLLFRSVVAGLFTLLPVVFAVLLVYTIMATLGIPLGMGTSMFATVAIGLGIDYAIHTLERMRENYNEAGHDMKAAFSVFYPGTGKALFFNFLAIAGGFSVLTLSKISSLTLFGAIVALAVSASFIASMTLLPALLKLFVPAFLRRPQNMTRPPISLGIGFVLFAIALSATHSATTDAAEVSARAQQADQASQSDSAGTAASVSAADVSPPVGEMEALPSADEVVSRINAVADGEVVSREIEMLMTDRRGTQRSRKTISFRKNYEDQKKTVLFYLEPANVRDTGFLIWDYLPAQDADDQWLYLPALRKVRRISAADRGDYFLGTDFTYEDIKLDGKLEPLDYDFAFLGTEPLDGRESYQLEATPKDESIAKELGYSRTAFWVDPNNWMIQRAKFWDLKGNLLKTLTVSDVRQVSDIWTRHELMLVNHQTGHSTQFLFSNVDYVSPIDDEFFTRSALERGI